MTSQAFTGGGHIVIGVVSIDRAERRGDRIFVVWTPNVRERAPVRIGRTTLLEQARLDSDAADRKLLPDLGAFGKQPLIHVAGVDLLGVRQSDPALLLGAVAPQRKLRRVGDDSWRKLARRDARVEPRLRQPLGELRGSRRLDLITDPVSPTARAEQRADHGRRGEQLTVEKLKLHGILRPDPKRDPAPKTRQPACA